VHRGILKGCRGFKMLLDILMISLVVTLFLMLIGIILDNWIFPVALSLILIIFISILVVLLNQAEQNIDEVNKLCEEKGLIGIDPETNNAGPLEFYSCYQIQEDGSLVEKKFRSDEE